MIACQNGNHAITKFLLESGADMTIEAVCFDVCWSQILGSMWLFPIITWQIVNIAICILHWIESNYIQIWIFLGSMYQ